jgi:DMSO/TMAO reductase YedYZ molybdopterin-dependent catalytic subunit
MSLRDRVIEARRKLRERFLSLGRKDPDGPPLGTGPLNRHGLPKLPIGQSETRKWPVLDLGSHPVVSPDDWRLVVDGACEAPYELGWDDFLALEQTDDESDFHCVTGWSRMDVPWRGVRVADLAALARPRAGATHLMVHAYDGYTTNVSLEEACKPDVLLVHQSDGGPLPIEHGGPVRMITPQLYAWKGAKWVRRLELLEGDRPGFWEQRGYSMTALPWRDDRYS